MESTQAIARKLADGGAPEGTVVQAGSQSAGRGRLGNSFYSPPGGLYISVILRPVIPPSQSPVIGLAAGLSVAEAIRDLAGLTPILKWPNDLLLKGRKVCGLLVDLISEKQEVRAAILGIGLNVNVPKFPRDLRNMATSLAIELGREISIEDLRELVLQRLEARYRELCQQGAQPVIRAWRSWPNMLGQQVRVVTSAVVLQGVAENIDSDGAMAVRLDSGELRRVVAGDVHLLP